MMTGIDHATKTPPSDIVEKEASAWLMKLEAASQEDGRRIDIDACAAENSEFANWLNASLANRIGFLRMQSTWRRADRLAALKSPSLSAPRSGFRLPRYWRQGAGVAAAAALAMMLVPIVEVFQSAWHGDTVYQTEIGSRETVRLADGSKLELNSNTRLSSELSDDGRIVILERGEAYFDVARDEKRPFKVIAGGQVVTVLGTKFSVHRRARGIEVAVTEGRVQIDEIAVADETPPTIVMAGDIVSAEAGAILVASTDMESVARELSWRQGYVIFDKTPLFEAAKEFNRYNRVELIISGAEIADIEISGRFTSENVDAFARLLSDGFDLEVKRERNKIIISG